MTGTCAVFVGLLLALVGSSSPQTKSPKYSHKQAVAALKAEGYKIVLKDGDQDDKESIKNGEISKGSWKAAISLALGSESSRDESGKTIEVRYETALVLRNRVLVSVEADRFAVNAWVADQSWQDYKVVAQFNQIVNFELPYAFIGNDVEVLRAVGDFKIGNEKLAKKFHARQLDADESYPLGSPITDSTKLPVITGSEIYTFLKLWKWEWKPNAMNCIDDHNRLVGSINHGWQSDILAVVDNVEVSFSASWSEPHRCYTVTAQVPVEKGVDAEAVVRRIIRGKQMEFNINEILKVIDSKGVLQMYWGKDGYYIITRFVNLEKATVGQFREDIVKFVRKVKELPRK